MIPSILHHVWTSDTPFSEKFHAFRVSWMKNNPSWDFRFWHIEDLPPHKFPNSVSDLLVDPDLHWVLKSDIMRWLVVWLYGGVYADTDVECVKSMDYFLKDKAFSGYSVTPGLVGNAVFGARPGYPLFLQIACAHAEKITGEVERANKNIVDYGVNLSGKMMLGCDHIYPASFFNPFGSGACVYDREPSKYPEAYCIHHWSGMDTGGWYPETIGKK
jgi:hypothetical protein